MAESELKITTRIVERNARHAYIDVWQNGGKAGQLVIEEQHAEEMIARLDGRTLALAREAIRSATAVMEKVTDLTREMEQKLERGPEGS